MSSKKKNILFIVTDDQRYDMLSCYPNESVKTPNLDMLAKRGVHFVEAHIPGGCDPAVCMPSRAMINSGRTLQHIVNHGANIPVEHTTLPEYLRQNDYTTYGIGKWHNGKESFTRSFDNGGAIFFGGMWDHWNVPCYNFHADGDYNSTIPYCPNYFYSNKVVYRDADYIQSGCHSSEYFSDKAIELLEQHDKEKNFYMYLAYLAPHDPRTMPKEFKEQYPADKIDLPANFQTEYPFDTGLGSIRDEVLAAYPRNEDEVKDNISDYYAIITHLDYHIGRVIQTLKDQNLYDDTIIVVAGDNGLAVGQHALMGKQAIYEHSIRIPLLISGPDIIENKRSNSWVYLCDIFPTICELLGLEIPQSVNAESFAVELDSDKKAGRDELFLSYCKYMRGLKVDNYKLIEYVTDNKERYTELFDLANDPNELNNLATLKPELVKQYQKRLYELAVESDDLSTDFGKIFWEGGRVSPTV